MRHSSAPINPKPLIKMAFFVDSSLFPLIPGEIAAMKNSTKLNQTQNIHIHNPSYPLVNIQKTIENDHF